MLRRVLERAAGIALGMIVGLTILVYGERVIKKVTESANYVIEKLRDDRRARFGLEY